MGVYGLRSPHPEMPHLYVKYKRPTVKGVKQSYSLQRNDPPAHRNSAGDGITPTKHQPRHGGKHQQQAVASPAAQVSTHHHEGTNTCGIKCPIKSGTNANNQNPD